jgi:hypothetical protein
LQISTGGSKNTGFEIPGTVVCAVIAVKNGCSTIHYLKFNCIRATSASVRKEEIVRLANKKT